jgi:NAD(P)-dependent dehydrogenase (short-subunit alcohol dehydrogenase family)
MGMNRRWRVIVTGGSTGIGEATALHLRNFGFSVRAGVRHDEDGERLRVRRRTPIRLDVTAAEQLAAARAEMAINCWTDWSTMPELSVASH